MEVIGNIQGSVLVCCGTQVYLRLPQLVPLPTKPSCLPVFGPSDGNIAVPNYLNFQFAAPHNVEHLFRYFLAMQILFHGFCSALLTHIYDGMSC